MTTFVCTSDDFFSRMEDAAYAIDGAADSIVGSLDMSSARERISVSADRYYGTVLTVDDRIRLTIGPDPDSAEYPDDDGTITIVFTWAVGERTVDGTWASYGADGGSAHVTDALRRVLDFLQEAIAD